MKETIINNDWIGFKFWGELSLTYLTCKCQVAVAEIYIYIYMLIIFPYYLRFMCA